MDYSNATTSYVVQLARRTLPPARLLRLRSFPRRQHPSTVARQRTPFPRHRRRVSLRHLPHGRLRPLGRNPTIPSFLFAPIVEPAILYTRVRYGLNLYDASPLDALTRAHTPVLLIHGTDDRNIPIDHSRRLKAANPATTELWEVPHAGHVAAWATGVEYERRITVWYATHDHSFLRDNLFCATMSIRAPFARH